MKQWWRCIINSCVLMHSILCVCFRPELAHRHEPSLTNSIANNQATNHQRQSNHQAEVMLFEVLVNEQFVVLRNGTSTVWYPRQPTTPTNPGQDDQQAILLDIKPPAQVIKPEFKIIKGTRYCFASSLHNHDFPFPQTKNRASKGSPVMDSSTGL